MAPSPSLTHLLTTSLLLLLFSSVLATPHGKNKNNDPHQKAPSFKPGPHSPPLPAAPFTPPEDPPTHYGVLLFRAFELMDIYGPLDILQLLAHNRHLTLSLLSRTLLPVTTEPSSPMMNTHQSIFWPTITPTHTFSSPPSNLEVLIVPGGPGARSPDLAPELQFIREIFPKLKYLITICTGSGIAAQSGVLDGYRATTNKAAWAVMTAMGPKVKWVSPARWVEDGKVWSSSGVTAGIDLIYEFLKQKYPNGTELAKRFGEITEYEPETDWRKDPWSKRLGVPVTQPGRL
ncbi:class I glutamine amidotransferase-like protein [Triangularia verruculosa]|uniref:Class I glutamine amidotransferase-like protein n=1 Tax=Triangularia verruculosa TaxID=2587418 RepID=A0AAN6XTV3_9PEZI|nr:class I glutamine amidotransferase-like protein [Triangularia verruculosa]